MIPRALVLTGVLAVLTVAACGDDDDHACDPVANTGCGDGRVCERVEGGDPICARPLVVHGRVFDLADGGGIVGARVGALDVNRAPVSSVAVSGADGAYALRIPSTRTSGGDVVGMEVTLRVDAPGYQTFPGGVRQALPIATGDPAVEEGELVVASALTDVGLIAYPSAGRGTIRGEVEVPASEIGVLVVAESAGQGATAIADSDGSYAIFNLADATYEVRAYARGLGYVPGEATIAGDDRDAEVDLALAGEDTARVTGSVNFANAPVGERTSVILVVASTFDDAILRGEAPPGLRVEVTKGATDFAFEGVPAGRYLALAAFENDLLVRDPDTTQGGTSIVDVEVAAGQDVSLGASFKVTDALATFGPGAEGPEAVTAAPTLRFEDDAGEDHFVVVVHDAFGEEVWTTEVPKHTSRDPEVPYEGPLEPGMFYQFRAVSYDADDVPLSTTEDLKGVFYVER